MRLVCVSDLHGLYPGITLPEGDVLVCAGDFTNYGELVQLEGFLFWVTNHHFSKRIVIAGNHDFCFEDSLRLYSKERLQDSGVTYLEASECEFGGIKFYGSPCTPKFFNWAFMLNSDQEAKKHWDLIPEDVQVLITHGPPYGILDRVAKRPLKDPPEVGDRAGDKHLAKRITKLPKLKAHIFGHLHLENGIEVINNTTYVNASICDEFYRPIRKPIVLDI